MLFLAGVFTVLVRGIFFAEAQAGDEFVTWDNQEEEAGVEDAFAPSGNAETGSLPRACGMTDEGDSTCAAALSSKYAVGAALLATVVGGILMRLRKGIRFRPLFLLGFLVVLGFGLGGCPCPIKGFQEAVLSMFGNGIHWLALGWFLLLLPLTYLFGRTWCGWVCHLGALQEFLYRKGIVPELNARAVSWLRWTRRILVIGLMLQLLATRQNMWEGHDPFRTAFNLMIPDTALAWVLLLGLLLSSVLIHRPFCRTACPVGLVLGWVSALPGAARLHVESNCTSCQICRKSCLNGAMGEDLTPAMESCIACGECVAKCSTKSLVWTHRKS